MDKPKAIEQLEDRLCTYCSYSKEEQAKYCYGRLYSSIGKSYKCKEAYESYLEEFNYRRKDTEDNININEYYRKVGICESIGRTTKHFKGDLYLIVDIAEHTETGDKMVVYRALYGKGKLYVRPLDMFAEECTEEQFKKYGQKYRFERVTVESVNIN